jgi:hypothetical protein
VAGTVIYYLLSVFFSVDFKNFYAMYYVTSFLFYVTLTSGPGLGGIVLVFESFQDPNPFSILALHKESRAL